jgi:hypothetical protein
MGSFYTNITLRGPDQARVLEALHDRRCYVAETENSCTVVFDEANDQQNIQEMVEFSQTLSSKFDCVALALLVHDDDILVYFLFGNGELIDQYDSSPAYFDQSASLENNAPAGGDAAKLAKAFDVADVQKLESILRQPSKNGYVFEFERHADLAEALGIPKSAVGMGFDYIAARDFPPGLSAEMYSATFDQQGRN